MAQQKRKKWTEEEERSLIEKYAEMQSCGALRRLPTREKRFRPIADHVNAAHHALDPSSYPFLWTWKDVSTKAQNMRHQYLLVKQKLLSPHSEDHSELDWADGLSLWPNFLRYRQVFGDAPLKSPAAAADPADADLGLGFGSENGGDDPHAALACDEIPPAPPSKRRKRRGWGTVAAMLARMGELEERMEEREAIRAKERRRSAAEEAAAAEVAARRREEEEREWEDRMERRREEWRKRMEEMMGRHRVEMEQIHDRVLHDQQAIISQLLAFVSHLAGPGPGPGIPDNGAHHHHHHHSPFLSQMMNGMVAGENRDTGDGQEDQFIVDE